MKKVLLALICSSALYAQEEAADLVMCDYDADGYTAFDLTATEADLLNNLSADDYTVTYHEIMEDAEAGTNAIAMPQNYTNVNQNSQTIYARVTENDDVENFYTASFGLIINPAPATPEIADITIFGENGIATVDLIYYAQDIIGALLDVSFYTTMAEAQNGSGAISNPESYVTASTILYAVVTNAATGCVSDIGSFNITVTADEPFLPPPPSGEATFYYELGDTLADIPVEGQNIQWYATETGDNPLSMATELTNNTTYYASQTVNDVESNSRLAVKAMSILLGIGENAFASLTYYPNPAKNVLNIANTNGIDTVTIVNTLGQNVLTKAISANEAHIDLSALGKGIYFVEVASGEAFRTLKIIKE